MGRQEGEMPHVRRRIAHSNRRSEAGSGRYGAAAGDSPWSERHAFRSADSADTAGPSSGQRFLDEPSTHGRTAGCWKPRRSVAVTNRCCCTATTAVAATDVTAAHVTAAVAAAREEEQPGPSLDRGWRPGGDRAPGRGFCPHQ